MGSRSVERSPRVAQASRTAGCRPAQRRPRGRHRRGPSGDARYFIVDAPGLAETAGLLEVVEQLPVEALVAELADEGFQKGVLGRLSRSDVVTFDATALDRKTTRPKSSH